MVDISGTVTDEDGDALDGVQVTVINETTDSVAATTTTDSNGDYSVTVGSDSYHVLFYYVDGGSDFNTDSYPYIQ
jgi:hypothetical protein